MKRFKLNEVWELLKWILLYEIVLVILIIVSSIFLDFEEVFKPDSFIGFISWGIIYILFLVIIEFLGLTQIYLRWFRKFGRVRLSKIKILKNLLNLGEGRKIEFKRSLRWDFEKGAVNKDLEKPVIKTIAGFLNSEGGSLIIGISDKKLVRGLENDFRTLPKKDKDGFENFLTQVIRSKIGSQSLRLINFEFYYASGKTVCLIKVKKSEDPVFTKINGSEEFFVRVGNSTASLSISESVNYIKNHWKVIESEKKE